jgi:hypothetical protein
MFTRASQCVRGVLDPPVSAFSLSLYRHPFLYTLFSSRFTLIINNKLNKKHLEEVCNSECTHSEHVCERSINFLVCSLSLHRHSYIGFIFSFRFIDS